MDFDVGTTTLVLHLIDMNTGAVIDTVTGYNGQAYYGEDILTRIQLAEQNRHLKTLHEELIASLNALIKRLAQNNNLEKDNLTAVSVAGNTVMIHFLLGVDPSSLSQTPHVPVINAPGYMEAQDIGLDINPQGIVYCLPNVGSYVGGDVIAGIIVSELHNNVEASLLVDIGTNGEIVIGNQDWIVACAGAAGPALEGDVVEAGMRATAGAVSNVVIDGKTKIVNYKTINDTKPEGICGSGLIDCVAELLLKGIIDRKGNFKEHTSHFTIVPAQETSIGKDIIITQKDIKSLIRTKGAVNTAMEVLLESIGCSLQEVTYFFASGAFGNYIDPESAVTIGLFPDIPRDKIFRIGNSSLEGARLALVSQDKREEAARVAEKITYFELNASQAFMNKFNSGQFLPHTNLDAYPTVKAKLEQ